MSESFRTASLATILAFGKSLSFATRGLTAHETGRRGPVRARTRGYQDASGRALRTSPRDQIIDSRDVSIACILPEVTEVRCSISGFDA